MRSDKDESFGSTIFQNYHVHTIKFTSIKNLFSHLVHSVSEKNINAIYTNEETFFEIKKHIEEKFPTLKFVFSPITVDNVTDRDMQLKIVEEIHTRAHRNYKNNVLEICGKKFWPTIRKDCKKYATKCEICLTEKYERRPKKETLKPTPIPIKPGHSIHIDIFHLSNRLFMSTCDRFSKYFYLREIPNKRNISLVIEEILSQVYPKCTQIMTDNESIFTSQTCQALFRQKKNRL